MTIGNVPLAMSYFLKSPKGLDAGPSECGWFARGKPFFHQSGFRCSDVVSSPGTTLNNLVMGSKANRPKKKTLMKQGRLLPEFGQFGP